MNVTSKTDGQPIIGASVVETTATTNGTITDFDGNFTLSVPVNSTLKITYIGYKPVTVKAAARHGSQEARGERCGLQRRRGRQG